MLGITNLHYEPILIVLVDVIGCANITDVHFLHLQMKKMLRFKYRVVKVKLYFPYPSS
jgi:hypothetical protein